MNVVIFAIAKAHRPDLRPPNAVGVAVLVVVAVNIVACVVDSDLRPDLVLRRVVSGVAVVFRTVLVVLARPR